MTTSPSEEKKWPCGCKKYYGDTQHVHQETYFDHSNARPRCMVEHDHWEGPMICGNYLPCLTHGSR
jgi:hypothetical protein